MTEDEIRGLLRKMGSEPVPMDSLQRVRLAVTERTQRRAGIWWPCATALAAATGMAVLMLWWREPLAVRKTTAPVVAREEAGPPNPYPAPVQPKPPVRSTSKRLPRHVENRPPSAVNVVIRIETPDPDVVILLIGD